MITDLLFQIYITFIFNFSQMIQTNLTVTLVGRIIFISCWIANYFNVKYSKKESLSLTRDLLKLNYRRLAWFIGKELLLLSLGFITILTCILVLAYSLLISGSLLISIGKRSRYKVNHILGYIIGGFLKYGIPIAGILIASYIQVMGTDPNAIYILIGDLTAIFLFVMKILIVARKKKKLEPHFSFDTTYLRWKLNVANWVPRWAKALMLGLIIACPVFLIFTIQNTVSIDYWTEYVEMDDGVLLATDVYRSHSAKEPQPVILIRTPYNKHSLYEKENLFIASFIKAGHTVVFQDMRGRFASEGEFIPFITDRSDGAATVRWIASQPWCNGKIGSWGGSALAINQYFYADEPTGALKFQSISVGSPEMYDHVVFQGGAFRKSLVESWLYAISVSNEPRRQTEYSDSINWFFDHRMKDEFWNSTSMSMDERYSSVNVSALHVGFWYDIFCQGTIDGFIGYNSLGGPGARGKQRMVIGPLGHSTDAGFGFLSDIFNGSSTIRFPNGNKGPIFSWEQEMMEWALKNGPEPDWDTYRVAYYLMGDVNDPSCSANEWRYAKDWPVPYTNTSYYFQGNMSLGMNNNTSITNLTYIYDP
ncbi:MAG: CocE/NonD family hydrolase, partial [Promethearchaeota archaeon]